MQDNTALVYFACLFAKYIIAGSLVNYFLVLVSDTLRQNRRKKLMRVESRK